MDANLNKGICGDRYNYVIYKYNMGCGYANRSVALEAMN